MKPVEDRASGKHIVTLMTYLPVEDIKEVWKGMNKADRTRLFGHGHAEELDNFVRSPHGFGRQDGSSCIAGAEEDWASGARRIDADS